MCIIRQIFNSPIKKLACFWLFHQNLTTPKFPVIQYVKYMHMYMYFLPSSLPPSSLPAPPLSSPLLSLLSPQGVGTVVSGTCMQGKIQLNDTLLLGPMSTGKFVPVSIRSIHHKRLPVKEVRGRQTASFALKKVSSGRMGEGEEIVHMGSVYSCTCTCTCIYMYMSCRLPSFQHACLIHTCTCTCML